MPPAPMTSPVHPSGAAWHGPGPQPQPLGTPHAQVRMLTFRAEGDMVLRPDRNGVGVAPTEDERGPKPIEEQVSERGMDRAVAGGVCGIRK